MKKTQKLVDSPEFYFRLAGIFLIVTAIKSFFPQLIPLGLFELIRLDFNWEAMKGIPWILLLFGPLLALLISVFKKNDRYENIETRSNIKNDLWTSIKAGVFEEISYRWLTFYSLIILFSLRDIIFTWLISISWISAIFALPWWAILCIVIVVNFIGGGAIFLAYADVGCFLKILSAALIIILVIVDTTLMLGIIKWLYTAAMLPLVNFITLGKMAPYLFGYSWMFGAALITANGNFGACHAYQGIPGWINSWIIGMLLFWFTLNFGLISAILVHVVYDISINLILYTNAKIKLAIR